MTTPAAPVNVPAKKNRGGRPTKLTPEVSKRIVELVGAGNFPETACVAAGVARPTLRAWLKEAADLQQAVTDGKLRRLNAKQTALVGFLTEMEKAMGLAESMHVMLVAKAAGKDWRASAWWLERMAKAHWAPTLNVGGKIGLTGDDGGPVQIATWSDLAKFAEAGANAPKK